jgi:hypothetical protein
MKKKAKRYNGGGKTEEQYKKEGLESSKEDKVGFFERLRMGNIDDPRSEAYQRFGAGRGRAADEAKKPVPESANKSSDYSGRNAKSYEDNGMNVPHSGTPSKNIARDTPKQDSSDSSSSSYMPKSTYKQPDIGDATNDNIKVKAPKKAVAPAPRKAEAPAPKKAEAPAPKTTGSGMAGSDKGSKASDKYKDIPLRKIGEAIEGTFSNAFKRVDPQAIREERRRIVEGKRKRDKAGESAEENKKQYGMKKGGSVSSASSRGDGIAQRGKTRGRLV